MSSPDKLRRALRLATAAALTLGLTACLRPLYGPTASGAPLAEVLAAVQIEPVANQPNIANQERLGHYLRSELTYDLNGSGQPTPKSYKLAITAYGLPTLPLTDSTTGRADAVTLNGSATYTLSEIDNGKVITTGRAVGFATYDRNPQRFAAVRAARDAEIRLGKMLAEQNKIRLATVLATNRTP